MRTLNSRRPMSCELAEERILAEQEATQRRVIEEHGQRPTFGREPVELVRFTGGSTTLGLVTDVANDLERSGRTVSIRWIRDERNVIVGAAIVEAA